MPELPEIEIVVRGLRDCILGKKFKSVVIKKRKLTNFSAPHFSRVVKNQRITAVDRLGKIVVIRMQKNILLFHLKMTGQLIFDEHFLGGHDSSASAATHLIFELTGGHHLYFNDQRQFGYCHLITPDQLASYEEKYGLDPIASPWRWSDFLRLTEEHPQLKLKAFLLSQHLLAGIGNIYADESAFAAGLHPEIKLNHIPLDKLKKLHRAIPRIMRKSIHHQGTTFAHFRTASGERGDFIRFLKVYGRADQPCSVCEAILEKTKVAGRGTVHCPVCQPKKN